MFMSPNILNTIGTIILGTLIFFRVEADPSPVSQTQTKLKHLDIKINNLQQTLANAQDKRGLLNKELSGTDKEIGEGVQKLRSIQQDMNVKKNKILELQNSINELKQKLSIQQQLLANHVKARYLMGEYQPVKWLLNQDEPYRVSRILTYYYYLVKARQQVINQIDTTRTKITDSKEVLASQLSENQELQAQLNQHQQQLQQNQSYHKTLIHSLNYQIQTNQLTLNEFQKDKDNLSRLLKSLSQQSALQSAVPFVQMRKKLPFPVHTESRSLQKMHQGVTFFADEGVAVTAVYPGKIVFSDWLKGYGLLLIIDHGQGFMTLYAHNQSLFKHKGQHVHQNEQIANVGHSGGIKQNGLYFEIRLRGKAISPLDWLS